jgi:CRISPR-associated protein Cmr1
LFEQGLLHGVETRDAVKVPTREEADCVRQIVEREIGLDLERKCFRIRFEELKFGPLREVTRSFAIQYGLAGGGERLWYVDRGSAELVVEEYEPCSLDRKTIEVALGALALSFRLSCFGLNGRRGFGCFRVRAHGIYSSLFNEEEPWRLVKRVSAEVGAVVKRATFECRGLRRAEPPRCALPPVPALDVSRRYDVKGSVAVAPYMLVVVRGIRRDDLYNFFLRPTGGNRKLEETLKTWVVNGVANKRPPPLMLAFADGAAYLSIFASADWPRELEWQRRQITEADLLAATASVLSEFFDYVEGHGGRVEVWPSGGV